MAITDLLKRMMPPAPARKIGRFDQPDFGLNNPAGTQGMPIPIDRAVRALSAMPPAPAPMIGAPSEAQRAQQDMPGPQMASAAPPATSVGMPPATVPQIGPAQQRLQGMASQGVPQLHGVKKVLDIAAQALVPTVEQAIPGTPGNYLRNLNVAHTQAMDEQAIEDQNLQRENIQSQISDRTAQQREREKAANAPEKPEKPITVESNGQAYEHQSDGSWKAIGTPKPESAKRYEHTTIEDPLKPGTPKDVLFDPTAQPGSNFLDSTTGAVIKGAKPYVKPEKSVEDAVSMTPEAVDMAAQVYVITGQLPPLGMGAAAAGMRQKILNRAGEFASGKAKPGSSAGDDVAKNKADFGVAQSPGNLAFFRSANSLLDKGGTLDQLTEQGQRIPQGQFPSLNSLKDWEALALGKGPLAGFAATALGVADDYAKVMGGGTGSDSAREQALALIARAQSPEMRAEAIKGIRNAVRSQRDSGTGNNAMLKKMYGGKEETNTQPPPNASDEVFAADGKTLIGHVVGGKYVPLGK